MTPNDLPGDRRGPGQDEDSGPNGLQNFPKLISAQTQGDTTTLKMNLATDLGKEVEIDLFVSDEADPSGYGEGRTYLETFSFTTPSNPHTLFIVVTVPAIPGGKFITATATGMSGPELGDTSEFSNAIEVREIRPRGRRDRRD